MLIYCCSDLIFSTKIASTAEALDIDARPARNLEMLDARLDRVDDGKANGPVTAVFVDLDLGEFAFELIKRAGSHDAQPRVIAFGPHVMREALTGAERVGAHVAMTRGAFTAELPELIRMHGQ
jgi:hypothetical protein